MLITGRQAAQLLGDVVPTRERARLLLRAGLAGEGIRTPAAVLYDDRAVDALANRSLVDERELAGACPQGLYVARLSRTSSIDLTQGWDRAVRQVAEQPGMPPLTRALVAVRIAHHGRLPWIATLFGFVVLGADATGVSATAARVTTFRLARPGQWFDAFAGLRFPARRGRPWLVWTPSPAGSSELSAPAAP